MNGARTASVKVTIEPVRSDGEALVPAPDFTLPERNVALEVATKALEEHPLPNGAVRARVEGTKVLLKIVVGDRLRRGAYGSGLLRAEILYDPHLSDPAVPVELVLHLRCYLGRPPTEAGSVPSPRGEELASRGMDPAGLRRTLWHEFAHFLDALEPTFGYSPEIKSTLSPYERAVTTELWNGYIDGRLARAEPEEDAFFRPAVRPSRPSLHAAVLDVWETARRGGGLTYREIVHLASATPPR